MKFELERLEESIRSIKEQLKVLPEGKLLCARNGTHVKWYLSDGHNQTYLPKKKRELAQQLALRKYLTEQLQYNLNERNAIQMYLRHHPKCNPEEMLQAGSVYQDLLCPSFQPEIQDLKDWANSPYEKNEKYSEKLIYKTKTGEFYYWEHLGMIDVKEYAWNASSKLNLFMDHGFRIGGNLIITSETKEEPLTPMDIERTIACYFLSRGEERE